MDGWDSDTLRREARDVGVELDEVALRRFAHLFLEVAGASVNVTSLRDPLAFRQKMVVDSLTCCAVAGLRAGDCVVDLGSGAGFPGLPIAIARPDVHVVLVESLSRKCAHLERVVTALATGNVEIACVRAEDLARPERMRERAQVVVARAVAPLAELLELAAPLCAIGGTVVAMKGPLADEEMAAAIRAPGALGLRLARREAVTLPAGEGRVLFAFFKAEATEARYPRRPAARKRAPL